MISGELGEPGVGRLKLFPVCLLNNRGRRGRQMGYLPRGQRLTSSITFILLIANVAVFVSRWSGATRSSSSWHRPASCSSQGSYWQPFTAMFVHFDILHILFNMFALVYFGTVVEGELLEVPVPRGLLRRWACGEPQPRSSSSRSMTRPAAPRARYSVSLGPTWRWRGRAPGWSSPRSTPA